MARARGWSPDSLGLPSGADVRKAVARQVRRYRMAANLPPDWMARQLGVAHTDYAQYEDGDRSIPAEHLVLISQLVGAGVAELVSDAPPPAVKRSLRRFVATAQDLAALPPAGQKVVGAMIAILKGAPEVQDECRSSPDVEGV